MVKLSFRSKTIIFLAFGWQNGLHCWNRLAKSSYHVEFRQIPRQLKFHVFRGNSGSTGHLAHFEWLKRCHVSDAELVKPEEPSGVHVDMWHLLSGWKSAIMDKGWDVIQMSQ